MALTAAAIRSKLETLMVAEYGPAADQSKRDQTLDIFSDWLFDVLTVQAATLLTNGLDSNGDNLVNLAGKIV